MEHLIRRCKHCGRKYTYCTYGNGPGYGTEIGCSMDYCAKCQKAIDAALEYIPIRIKKKHKIVTDPEQISHLEKIFEIEKQKCGKVTVTQLIPDWGYEIMEKCYINSVEYFKCVEKNGSYLFQEAVEWDCIDGKFTEEKYLETDENSGTHYVPVVQLRFHDFNKIKEKPMSPPKGDLLFDIPEWELKLND